MTIILEKNDKVIAKLVANIKEHRNSLQTAAIPFRTLEKKRLFDKLNYDDWCYSVFGDGLIKLSLFTENNFNDIETLGLVSVTRYIFELSVWLNLFIIEPRYGLVYYGQLIKGQLQYWMRFQEQMEREVSFLTKIGEEEKELMKQKMSKILSFTDKEQYIIATQSAIKNIYNTIDLKAARKFSIHAEQAQTNGYDYQAYLIENKQLPLIKNSISEIEKEKQIFESSITDDIKSLIPKRWKWDFMAKKISLDDEYSFIYSFTSKLLHAVPTSITTNQKNLAPDEIIIFLKYIDIKIRDIIELSQTYLKRKP